MPSLKHVQTLYYYDGHQLLVTVDPVGTRYVCLLEREDEREASYCCVPISEHRLTHLRFGELDLREAFSAPEIPVWYLAKTTDVTNGPMAAIENNGPVPEDFLPDPGFKLEFSANDSVTKIARERQSPIVEIGLNPPESATHKIAARTLAAVLNRFQSVIKYAHLETRRKANVSSDANPDVQIMDVLAFSPGSFKFQMQSRAGLDLLGDSEIESTLEFVEKVFGTIRQPKSAIEFLTPYRGHFVSSVAHLLSVLDAEKSSLEYSWTLPNFQHARGARVDLPRASDVLGLLSKNRELSIEKITISGRLTKADERNNSWRLADSASGKEIGGKVRPGTKLSMAGLVIDAMYKIACEERIHDDQKTGKEKRVLYAIEFERLGSGSGNIFPKVTIE